MTKPEQCEAPPAESFWRQVRRIYCQLFGVPDYEAYLGHMRTHHPGIPCLERREFVLKAWERRYGGGGGTRCC